MFQPLPSNLVPVPSDLKASCALAYEVCRDLDNQAVEVPVSMRSFLHHSVMSPRALTVALNALETDPVFRAYVASAASTESVGRAGYDWLHATPIAAPDNARHHRSAPQPGTRLSATRQISALRHGDSFGDQVAQPQYATVDSAPPEVPGALAPSGNRPPKPQPPLIDPPVLDSQAIDPQAIDIGEVDALHCRIRQLEEELCRRNDAWREALRQLSETNADLESFRSVLTAQPLR